MFLGVLGMALIGLLSTNLSPVFPAMFFWLGSTSAALAGDVAEVGREAFRRQRVYYRRA
jgi:hypothetical protein